MPVDFTSGDTAIATVTASGLVHIKNSGTVQIIANQSGNLYYNAALAVSQSLMINSNQVNIYPNPAKGVVNFEYSLDEKKAVKLLMFSSNGQLVKNCLDQISSIGKHTVNIDVTNLITGVYQLHFIVVNQLNIY